jgi:transcription-repair coupling factor (superfamily II helicase)
MIEPAGAQHRDIGVDLGGLADRVGAADVVRALEEFGYFESDGQTEFLHLTYANDATLYVPVSQLHLIGRYSGVSADEAPLHALGSGQWEKAKQRAAKRARDTAAELLNIYARRASRQGHAFRFEAPDYEAFAEGFGFDETPDQLAAIHAVTQDLGSGKPMDRLICGDVGFGKTEVALRAAFIAAADGKQVAILCPTTLLAEQHFETFTDRFSNWPMRLAELSRFRSPKEVRVALDGLADGKVDIVIGTHKLLSKEVRFARLGLVIIDEEHRFGVRQKEAFKALRAEASQGAGSPPPRNRAGFWGTPCSSTSKCRCGPVERPVLPTSAMICPRRTMSPGLTSERFR